MLGARGGEQQELGFGAHAGVAQIYQDVAYLVPDRCAAGFAGQEHVQAARLEVLGQKPGLGGFAAAVGAFQRQKHAQSRKMRTRRLGSLP